MPILKRLIPFDELKETVLRFPLSILCAVVVFLIGALIVNEYVDEDEAWVKPLAAILGLLYLWFGISKLMAESQKWSKLKHLVISFVVAGGISAIILLSSLWLINLIFIIPALLFTLMVAPYLKGGDDISMWFFNRMTWFGVIVSYAAILLFAGGVSAAILAVQTLFYIDIGEDFIFFYIWLFAALILGPVYALSWVPKTFEYNDDDCRDPAGLKFIINWISVPIVFLYLLILYAYFIKIIIIGEVPNGHLAYMITGFAGAGVITYLVAHPFRNEGSPQLKLFYKIFFPALLIPVGFHFYAIWERISAYGITEQRYLILISAIWFLFMAVIFSIKKAPIKLIPASLAILMAVASFGPWGGVSLSGYSQFSRLEMLLVKNDLLVDGKVVKSEGEIPFDDRLNISSILDYLCRSDRDAMIEPWFNADNEEEWECYSGGNTTAQLGFKYVDQNSPRRSREMYFNLYAHPEEYVDISGYDVMVRNIYIYRHKDNGAFGQGYWSLKNGGNIDIEFSKGVLGISIYKYQKIEINIDEFASSNAPYFGDSKILLIESENKDISYRLAVFGLGGKVEGGNSIVGSLSFNLFYRIKSK